MIFFCGNINFYNIFRLHIGEKDNMKKYGVIIFFIAVLLLACSTKYPLGMTKKEFMKLSEQEQLEARKKQAEIDAQKYQQDLQYQEKMLEQKKIYEEQQKAKYEQIYKTMPIIRVSISDGTVEFARLQRKYQIPPFLIAMGEVKKIKIYMTENYTTYNQDVWVSYQPGGFYFDVTPDNEMSKILDSYITFDTKGLIENNYIKPYIIPESNKWRAGADYPVNHNGNIKTNNININIEYHQTTREQIDINIFKQK